jgi:bile acid-coenzyme A ligase
MIGGCEWLEHPGSVGRAPEGTTIVADDGELVSPGEIGTVYFIPPPNNPMGHPQEPRTFGDAGWIDDGGFLYLADRRTDMILTGGVNIYPAEIEGVIEQVAGVTVAAVIGLPDSDLGAKAHAIIELADGAAEPTATELAEFLHARLSSFKVPYTFEIVRTPLRDEAGKLRRVRLREERLLRGSDSLVPLRAVRN